MVRGEAAGYPAGDLLVKLPKNALPRAKTEARSLYHYRIGLSREEADALIKLAYSELRDPRDQIRLIVRHELQEKKLLPIEKLEIINE